MPSGFEHFLAVLGVLLIGGAFISGLAHRTFLSLTALFVIAGLVLGRGGLKVLDFAPRSSFVEVLAVVALILILFRDGLEVEAEMLQTAWHLPLRKLVLAMPLTAGVVACATKALTDLSWTESFLVGALLSPTDPVLSSNVVTNPRVPRRIRHSLNLESGLNDGLALPAVLALAAALDARGGHFVWWRFVLQDLSIGLICGGLVGTNASLGTRAFMAWFGPKGVATMTFALLILSRQIEDAGRIFNIAALAVLVSIAAHGATDVAGVGWIARRAERAGAR